MAKKNPPSSSNKIFKRRAVELFHKNSPFRQKIVRNKKKYDRKREKIDDIET